MDIDQPDTYASAQRDVRTNQQIHSAVPLDPDGDAILILEDPTGEKRFLVSSKILSLASPVFSSLFTSGFKEGIQTRRGDCPSIPLREDNADAMEIILSILHYKNDDIPNLMDAESLAHVAIQSDKYDCNHALKPWISHWCKSFRDVKQPKDMGFMLLAAYLFRSVDFYGLSKQAAQELPPTFTTEWEQHESLAMLPDFVTDLLSLRIQNSLDDMHQELQRVEEKLRENHHGYSMPGVMCMNCGRTHPDNAKKCHPCNNTVLYEKHCTSEYRVADYFAILKRAGLWPSIVPFKKFSATSIALMLTSARIEHKHQCEAEEVCPLRRELERVDGRVTGVLIGMEGLHI
ncbi:hypothetical protein PT974_04782 [Cladobotryum mycophilum]|uniref:BTB domain-containing protein n=1 Tax=Cladobotryum mycophilum TaxID=491253 RepID=A0ABR0SQH8_9HYPO